MRVRPPRQSRAKFQQNQLAALSGGGRMLPFLLVGRGAFGNGAGDEIQKSLVNNCQSE